MAKLYAGSYERFLFGFDVEVQDAGSDLVSTVVEKPVERIRGLLRTSVLECTLETRNLKGWLQYVVQSASILLTFLPVHTAVVS